MKRLNLKHLPRSGPGFKPIKKTINMIRAATIFGNAGSLSKDVMTSLAYQLPGNYSMFRRNMLTGLLNKALIKQWDKEKNEFKFSTKGFKYLKDFEFDAGVSVSDLLNDIPGVTLKENTLTVSIDPINLEEDIIFYDNASRCEFVVGVSFFKITEEIKVELSENQIIVLDKHRKTVGPYQLDFEVPAKCLCVVTLFLHYVCASKAGWKPITRREFAPGCILEGVYTSEKVMDTKERKWVRSKVKCSEI